jgi:hypothetical protein
MADDFLENYDELEFVGNDRKIAKESWLWLRVGGEIEYVEPYQGNTLGSQVRTT